MTTESRKLARYYMHTEEWWGQAVWVYNKMTNSAIPNLWDAVVASAHYGPVPDELDDIARTILDFWEENHRLAELMLPEN